MGRRACTEPQCLYKGAIYLYLLQKMRFECRITKAKLKKHIRHTWSLFFHNWLIPPDLVKCLRATLKNSPELRNDLSVITICLTKPYVSRQPPTDKYSFVSLQHAAVDMKKYVRFVVAGDISFPQKHCCATLYYFCTVGNNFQQNDIYTECNVVSTATMAARTHQNVTLHVHCLSCLLLEKNKLFGKLRVSVTTL